MLASDRGLAAVGRQDGQLVHPFGDTSLAMTLAPSMAKRMAGARPIPDPAPVTMAVWPCKRYGANAGAMESERAGADRPAALPGARIRCLQRGGRRIRCRGQPAHPVPSRHVTSRPGPMAAHALSAAADAAPFWWAEFSVDEQQALVGQVIDRIGRALGD